MRNKILIGLIAGFTMTLSSLAVAADTYMIDPSHTSIHFAVNHLGYSKTIGRFNDISGEFTFDEENIESSALEVVIKTSSVDTNHQARDDDLRSPGFFSAVEFPEITFESTAIEKTGDNTGKITGDLTMLGVSKPVTLDVTFNKKAPHPLPQLNGVVVVGFSATASLVRSEWGMGAGVPNIGDEITFWIEVEGHQK